MQQGDLVYFEGEKRPYRVKAKGKRYAVCTKPFNPKHTVLYTVIDFEKQIRGTENLVFGMGAETQQDCDEMLERLESGDTEVSHRNWCHLDIREV